MTVTSSPTPGTSATAAQQTRVLVYSDDVETRQQVLLALGRRPARDLPPFAFVEVATAAVLLAQVDAGGFDLLILDGESTPAGGLGMSRQLKNEIFNCPPILVLTGRVQDNWLATWSLADAAVAHPLDPIALSSVVLRLLRAAGGAQDQVPGA
ncbi:MAG: response regulator transcription factor [Marmoricola sp.]